MIVGYDTRFLGEQFAEECANVISANAFRALLCDGPVPTPTISHAIRSHGAVCGINFTASHNPPQYNGMKLSTSDGAPALPEITRSVEELIEAAAPSATGANAASRRRVLTTFAARVRLTWRPGNEDQFRRDCPRRRSLRLRSALGNWTRLSG